MVWYVAKICHSAAFAGQKFGCKEKMFKIKNPMFTADQFRLWRKNLENKGIAHIQNV